jgi:hypothetical protein
MGLGLSGSGGGSAGCRCVAQVAGAREGPVARFVAPCQWHRVGCRARRGCYTKGDDAPSGWSDPRALAEPAEEE